jgi:hypothetical protein
MRVNPFERWVQKKEKSEKKEKKKVLSQKGLIK